MLSGNLQFCVLAYRPRSLDTDTSEEQTAVLLVLRKEVGQLRLLVNPEWRKIVEGDDIDYLDSLLKDFRERAKMTPETLFKQICSFGVGPIVAQETGQSLDDHPLLLDLLSKFVNL
jgi:predicted NAD/FAD-binding protein